MKINAEGQLKRSLSSRRGLLFVVQKLKGEIFITISGLRLAAY
jgi:hypothetical protein